MKHNSATRVAVIGAGWYGCHIAKSLLALGMEVRVFEKTSIFSGASGNNQFRLHSGFHYPRNYKTRIQSRQGYQRFLQTYPGLSKRIQNIYAVSRDSLVDFMTYREICTSSLLEFQDILTPDYIKQVEGCLETNERVILTSRATEYFTHQLSGLVTYGNPEIIHDLDDFIEVNGERFDYLVDATWGQAGLETKVIYEPTLLLYYQSIHPFPAITVMDGPFCALYPTGSGLYTLSSVPHTPLGQYKTYAQAKNALSLLGTHDIKIKRELMERQISQYIPEFRGTFRFDSPQMSIKTKPLSQSADRSCSVEREGNIFKVLSGKIDTIFVASDKIIGDIG